jgi:hypothetical protein
MNPVHTFTPYLCNVNINNVIVSRVFHVASLSHDFLSFDIIMFYMKFSFRLQVRRIVVFWFMTPYSHHNFEGICCLHFYFSPINLDLFSPEDYNSYILRNVGSHSINSCRLKTPKSNASKESQVA